MNHGSDKRQWAPIVCIAMFLFIELQDKFQKCGENKFQKCGENKTIKYEQVFDQV